MSLPNTDEHLLAFVISKEYDELFLHLDAKGVEALITQLEHIRNALAKNECEHFHMFSGEWGDGELSISKMAHSDTDGISVHHLKIYGWTDEWVEKHGFQRS